MDKARVSQAVGAAKEKAEKYTSRANQFFPPQSTREKKLIVSYSVLTVLVTAIVNGLISGNHTPLFGASGGGSKTVFKVDSVRSIEPWYQGIAQNLCAPLDQTTEFNTLMSEGWKITSTQNQSKPIEYAGIPGFGECLGTLYIFTK